MLSLKSEFECDRLEEVEDVVRTCDPQYSVSASRPTQADTTQDDDPAMAIGESLLDDLVDSFAFWRHDDINPYYETETFDLHSILAE